MSTVELTDAALGQTLEVRVGDRLVLRLLENPTTGFRWQTSSSGDGELRQVDDRFEPGGAPLLPGAAGHRVLTFLASGPGTVTLSLVQQRLPEPPAGPSKQLTAVIRSERSAP